MTGESITSLTLTPVTTPANVRLITGYTSLKDADDATVVGLIQRAQVSVGDDLSARRHNIPLWGVIDGTNAVFELDPRYLDRIFLDVNLSGDEKNNVQVFIRNRPVGNAPPTYTAATVQALDVLHGQVTLTAAPSATTAERILLTAWMVPRPVYKQRFAYVVELYAAHLLDTRIRGPGTIPIANPQVGGKDGVPMRSRWLDLYRDELKKLTATLPAVAGVRTSLRNRRAFYDALDTPEWTAYHGTSP